MKLPELPPTHRWETRIDRIDGLKHNGCIAIFAAKTTHYMLEHNTNIEKCDSLDASNVHKSIPASMCISGDASEYTLHIWKNFKSEWEPNGTFPTLQDAVDAASGMCWMGMHDDKFVEGE